MDAVVIAQQLVDLLARAKAHGDSVAREALSLFVFPGCWLEPKLLEVLEEMVCQYEIYQSFAGKPEIRQLRRGLAALDNSGRARFRCNAFFLQAHSLLTLLGIEPLWKYCSWPNARPC